jgi:hypothetical protein
MRHLNLAVVIASASLAAACAPPPMTTYDYPKYGFTADFQAPPKVTDTINAQSGAHVIVLDAKSFGRDFAITVTDVDPKRDIDALVDDASEAVAKAGGGAATYRTTVATAEGALGREMVFSKDGRCEARVRFYRSGPRFYVLTAKGMGLSPVTDPGDVDPCIGAPSDSDRAVTAFLTSFHLADAAPP